MLGAKEITERMFVRICSRPDMGIVQVIDVLRFGKLVCARTSKGGIFDRFDLIKAHEEECKKVRTSGEVFNHSKRDWLKRGTMAHEFFCIDANKTVSIYDCKDCYEKRLNREMTRAECKSKNMKDGSRVDIESRIPEIRKEQECDTGRDVVKDMELGGKGIQELRVEQLKSLNH